MLERTSSPARLARALGLFTFALLAGCGGGGGGSGGSGASPQQVALFDLRRDVTVANSGLTDAVYVDVDADGVADLVQCDYADHTLAVGRGLFDGNFALTQSLVTPGHPWALAVADYDGDGRVDVAVACRDESGPAGRIALWLNTGNCEFVAGPALELTEAPIDVTPIASPLALPLGARARLLVAQLGLAR
ncbi:MAG: VCBS repeat-containing protein, partial [Planctomycetota bacterium]